MGKQGIKELLRLGSMPVCEITSILATNFLCCLYGNQTSEYYLGQGHKRYSWRERCNYEDDVVVVADEAH